MKSLHDSNKINESPKEEIEVCFDVRNLGKPLTGFICGLTLTIPLYAAGDKPSTSASKDKATESAPADNSKVNQVHDGDHAITADQQKNSDGDVEVTRKIRRAITEDKSLSTYAHNVKIITNNGQVVLKGPVRSQTEKQTIENVATQVAGRDKVKNEIEVAAQ